MPNLSTRDGCRGAGGAASLTSSPVCITEIRPTDILMGRGVSKALHVGNVSFRKLVLAKKAEYCSALHNREKHAIAMKIVREISQSGGRFLRKVCTRQECEALGFVYGTEAWILAEPTAVIEKVKQALREKVPRQAVPMQRLLATTMLRQGHGGALLGPRLPTSPLPVRASTLTLHVIAELKRSIQRLREQEQFDKFVVDKLAAAHQVAMRRRLLASLPLTNQQTTPAWVERKSNTW